MQVVDLWPYLRVECRQSRLYHRGDHRRSHLGAAALALVQRGAQPSALSGGGTGCQRPEQPV